MRGWFEDGDSNLKYLKASSQKFVTGYSSTMKDKSTVMFPNSKVYVKKGYYTYVMVMNPNPTAETLKFVYQNAATLTVGMLGLS